MRIGILNYEWPGVTDNCGGGGRIGQRLAHGLKRNGHSVDVLKDMDDGHYATYPVRIWRRLRDYINDVGPDVIHGQFSVPSSVPLLWQREVPCVVTTMGADVYDPTRFRAIRPAMRAVNLALYQRADEITTCSQDLADRMWARPLVIPYGIRALEFDRGDADLHTPVRLLTVARKVERKNLQATADAIASLPVDVDWRVIGTGPVTLPNWVDTRGFVDSVKPHYEWGDIFALPSYHEGFGIVFLEALASGMPILTGDVGGQLDILQADEQQPGVAVEPNQREIWKGLQRIITGYTVYQRNTRRYVQTHFSERQFISAYEDLYRKVATR